MATDRDLLELAAKAAGLSNYRYCDKRKCMIDCDVRAGAYMTPWIPLTDDGDALRLAASLEISVTFSSEFVNAIATQHGDDGVVPFAHESWTISNQDCYAATRRAIVRCAAEIGRNV